MAAYEQLTDVDVIHDHTLSGPLLGPRRTDVPIVATHHGVFDDATTRIFRDVARSAKVIAISHCQAAAAADIPIAAVVHHGIDVADFALGDGEGGYLAFLGRMVPEKGPHHAIRIARRLGMPLLLAAKMREAPEMAFFEAEVRHLLGGDDRVHRRARPPRQGAAAVRRPRPAQPHRLAGAVRDGDARGARLRHAGRGAGRGRGTGDRRTTARSASSAAPTPSSRRESTSWTGSTA